MSDENTNPFIANFPDLTDMGKKIEEAALRNDLWGVAAILSDAADKLSKAAKVMESMAEMAGQPKPVAPKPRPQHHGRVTRPRNL